MGRDGLTELIFRGRGMPNAIETMLERFCFKYVVFFAKNSRGFYYCKSSEKMGSFLMKTNPG